MMTQPITEWGEGDLECRLAELRAEIADGAFTGDVLRDAIRERDAVAHEIMLRRLGDYDDDEAEDDPYEDYLERAERSFMGLDEF